MSGPSASSVLTIPGVQWTANQYAGSVVYVVNGKGAYQRRRVTSNTSNALSLDKAWDVPLDDTSYVSLQTDHSDGIVYNNTFSNVTASVLLYSQSYGFVIDNNQGEGTGGSSCLGWSNGTNPQRNFNNCYFNEWTNNTYSGSLNSTNPNKHGGTISVLGQNMTGVSEYISNTAILGPILDPTGMDSPTDYAAPIVGNIVRGNTLNAVAEGVNQGWGTIGGIYNRATSDPVSCAAQVKMPNGGATDTLVEKNTVSNSAKAVFFYPLFGYTLIQNNTFNQNQTNVAEFSFTTCQSINGAVPAATIPAAIQ